MQLPYWLFCSFSKGYKDKRSASRVVTSKFGKQVRAGQLATVEGISYLEVKHLLLLHYCIHLVFYFLLKAEGRPVADHPVIGRLVEIRAFLDRARPIDKRLRYQMDKLLAAASAVQVAGRSSCLGSSFNPQINRFVAGRLLPVLCCYFLAVCHAVDQLYLLLAASCLCSLLLSRRLPCRKLIMFTKSQ
jgi:hypothetical protein